MIDSRLAFVTFLISLSLLSVNAGCNPILATSKVIDIDHVDKTSLHTSNISSGNDVLLLAANSAIRYVSLEK